MTQTMITPATAPNIIVVPDMSAVDLTQLTNDELKLTYLDPDYAAWDYYRTHDGELVEGRGQKFDTLVVPKTDIKPSGNVSFAYASDYLRERGYAGHVGGFTEWRRQNLNLMGWYVSIPEDRACWSDCSGDLYVPFSYFRVGERILRCSFLGANLHINQSVVGFRAVS